MLNFNFHIHKTIFGQSPSKRGARKRNNLFAWGRNCDYNLPHFLYFLKTIPQKTGFGKNIFRTSQNQGHKTCFFLFAIFFIMPKGFLMFRDLPLMCTFVVEYYNWFTFQNTSESYGQSDKLQPNRLRTLQFLLPRGRGKESPHSLRRAPRLFYGKFRRYQADLLENLVHPQRHGNGEKG